MTLSKQSEQIAKSIEELPPEAQSLIRDFIEDLQERYSNVPQQEPDSKKSTYEAFQELGLIGCVSLREDLSTNYKQILTESLNEKYGDS